MNDDSVDETQSRRAAPLTLSAFALKQELRDLYHSPRTGYRSIENLYRKVKEDFPNATREKVRNFLKTQDTYTKTFPKGGLGLGKNHTEKQWLVSLDNNYRWILS